MTKANFLPFLGFFLVGYPLFSIATDYCKFSTHHVLCGIQKHGPNCGDPSQVSAFSTDSNYRQKILEIHNNYRNLVASGEATTQLDHRFPQASTMEELVWDTELESIAKAVSKKCSAEPSCKDCIRVDRFEVVGENIHHTSSGDPGKWKAIIDYWTVNEAAKINFTLSSKKTLQGYRFKEVPHLVEAINAKTTHIGCARVTFKDEIISVCHYGEGGNFENAPLYKPGPPCSKCPGGRRCSTVYPSLCRPDEKEMLTMIPRAPKGRVLLQSTTAAAAEVTTVLKTTTPAGPKEDKAATVPGPKEDEAATVPGPKEDEAATVPGPKEDEAATVPGSDEKDDEGTTMPGTDGNGTQITTPKDDSQTKKPSGATSFHKMETIAVIASLLTLAFI